MKNIKEITYGVCKNLQGRYFIVVRGKGIDRLNYSNKATALKKAYHFAKSMYRDFKNDNRDQSFKYLNLGELKELNYNKQTATAETHFIPVGMDFIVAEHSYTLCQILYKGAEPTPAFSFKANNIDEAISKGKDWALYHSLCFREDCIVREATEYETEHYLHQEYVS